MGKKKRKERSRAPTYGFYGGVLGTGIGFLLPALVGPPEYAGLLQLVYGAAGFLVGMGAGLLVARLTRAS